MEDAGTLRFKKPLASRRDVIDERGREALVSEQWVQFAVVVGSKNLARKIKLGRETGPIRECNAQDDIFFVGLGNALLAFPFRPTIPTRLGGLLCWSVPLRERT